MGYTSATDDYYKSVIGWMEGTGSVRIKNGLLKCGVVPALKHMYRPDKTGRQRTYYDARILSFRSVAETQGEI